MSKIAVRLAVILVCAAAGGFAAAQDRFADVKIEVTPVAGGVHMLTGAGGNMGLFVGEDGPFLVDDQYAPLSERIMAAIATVTDEPVTFVFNTHYHGDHTGGNEAFGETGSFLVSHANVRRRLTADQFSELLQRKNEAAAPGAWPVITFTDSLTFHWNGDEVRAFHVPHAHTDGDGVLHFPGANVVHSGDVIFFGLYPYIDTSAGGSIDGMIAGVERILGLCDDETRVIPGHGPLLGKAEVAAHLAMLKKARAQVAAAMADGSDLAAVLAKKPCAEWDESHGQVWLTSDQFVESVYASLAAADGGHAGHGHHH
ncbi:MBL fold metallo-hydrolase [bacterium]|nr:MBL fold metallo-hydrolase [bacterium]